MNRTLPFQPPKQQNLLFKKRIEARWAFFFTSLGLEWYYEPKKFRFADLSAYTPDFFVRGLGWIEIKEDLRDCNLAISKARKVVAECTSEAGEGTRHFTICGDWAGFEDSVLFEWKLGAIEPFLFNAGDALELFTSVQDVFGRFECQRRIDFANSLDLKRFGSLTPEGIGRALAIAARLASRDDRGHSPDGHTHSLQNARQRTSEGTTGDSSICNR